MRIWSLHPKYLDAKGLVALWREALLAKHVLEGRTKGYRNHPQLIRFKNCEKSLHAINHYLSVVHEEAGKRNYQFDSVKIDWSFDPAKINVTRGQVDYETRHLKSKLQLRDPVKFNELTFLTSCEVHPVFTLIEGEIENWEILIV